MYTFMPILSLIILNDIKNSSECVLYLSQSLWIFICNIDNQASFNSVRFFVFQHKEDNIDD